MRPIAYQFLIRVFTSIYYLSLVIVSLIVPRKTASKSTPERILITGTFYSDQWLTTHLIPLAASSRVKSIVMIASSPVPEIKGVTAIYPNTFSKRVLGEVGSRSLLFAWHGLKRRYDVVAGFHLLLNGMIAVLVGRLTRKRSLYFCGGGPREVSGGGYTTENKIYGRLHHPDQYLEKLLLKTIDEIDVTVCMGSSAVDYFRSNRVTSQFAIIPGGFSSAEFFPTTKPKKFDLALVGRLSEVKQVDLFLNAIALAKKSHPNITAVVVGDGPDRQALEALSRTLGLSSNVTFAGWQSNVADWLRNSKIFVLTSSSEGLSQALIQALICGLPAVVSNVGDLRDLVQTAFNGYLIDELSAKNFAARFTLLLTNSILLKEMSEKAVVSTRKFSVEEVAKTWQDCI
jgi:L-malate glycosyltransferase